MSEKRSDRLRSIIAATVTDAAENAAPVTVTGSGIPATDKEESRLKTTGSREAEPVSSRSVIPERTPPKPIAQADSNSSPRTAADEPPSVASTRSPRSTMNAAQAGSPERGENGNDLRALLRAPERPVKLPKWEKANVTLEPRDLAILQRSDAQARAYGFRIRKGGNPSLFVRAGLRLLDELVDRDPEAWIKRIAATTPVGTDTAE